MDQATFFLEASQELKRLFAEGFVKQTLKAGETLFEQEDFDDKLYVLDDGVLEVSVYSSNGRKLALNMLRSGSVFGEIAMFDPGKRTARISAIEDSKLRYLRQSTVIAAVQKEPHLAAELLSFAGKRMRWMTGQVQDQVFLSPTARLAGKVIYLAGDSGQVALSQAQLADYVGVSREVVSRTLAEWRREGLVALSRGSLEILDVKRLENIRNSENL